MTPSSREPEVARRSTSSAVVPPLVRRVRSDREPNLGVIPNRDGLRDRVAAALAATPIDSDDGEPVTTGLRRILLGPRGMPWDPANAWLQRTKERAPGTEEQYASAVRLWVAYCAARNKDPLLMTFDILVDYRQARLDEDGIDADTWNASLSPLKWLHESAASGPGVPHQLTEREWKDLRKRGSRIGMPRVVSPDVYARFRVAGLQGRDLLTGHPTPTFYALRTPVRDALFADFLLAHGPRRAEACHLTLLDLPRRRDGYVFNTGTLSPKICKGEVGREFREQRRWVARLAAYQNTEWMTTVDEAQRSLRRMRARNELLVVTNVRERFARNPRLKIDGHPRERKLLSLTKDDRRRLVCTPEVAEQIAREVGMGQAGLSWAAEQGHLIPLAVFPGTRAPMISPEAWGLTFREANQRVNAAIQAEHPHAADAERVTPHMLRHTFATEWLSERLAALAESDREFADGYAQGDIARLRHRFFNPLLEIKALLGHSNLDTTLRYIHHLMQEKQATAMPGNSWIESYLGND